MCISPTWTNFEVPRSDHLGSTSQHNDLCADINSTRNIASRCSTAKAVDFADPDETVIIFDWDDTLFPLTYVLRDLHLDPKLPLQDQPIPEVMKRQVALRLAECAREVAKLLSLSAKLGQVVVVTLSQNSWVVDSCKNFFPEVQEVIESIGITIVYASSFSLPTPPQAERECSAKETARKRFEEERNRLSELKAKAISQTLRSFYSQYEGQSWKNVVSIGDSDFERLGTQQAVQEYMQRLAAHVDGQGAAQKVRTKILKTMEQPVVEELTAQLVQTAAWLPAMVSLDDSFDIHLTDIDDPRRVQAISKLLQQGQP